MTAADVSRRWAKAAALAVVLIAIAGCSSGGDGGASGGGVITPPITASFLPSGTAASPNLVRLTGSAVGDLVTIHVAVSGQTASDELWAFAFDLVLSDAALAGYIDGTVSAGPALVANNGEQLFANASQTGNRVTVGVTKVGNAAGNGIGPSEEVIVSLDFLVEERGSVTISIAGSSPDPAALDPDLDPISSVIFDTAQAAITGS